jgi:hypothetical protein
VGSLLVVEVDKDSGGGTEAGFHLGSNSCCAECCIDGSFTFDSPTRVLVPCPPAASEDSCDVGVESTRGMVVVVDVVGAEVVLQDIVGFVSGLSLASFIVKLSCEIRSGLGKLTGVPRAPNQTLDSTYRISGYRSGDQQSSSFQLHTPITSFCSNYSVCRSNS